MQETQSFTNTPCIADRGCINRTRKTNAVGISRIACFLLESDWRRVVKLFRHDHNPLLVANLTAFNEPRIYLSPVFTPPLRLILSRL